MALTDDEYRVAVEAAERWPVGTDGSAWGVDRGGLPVMQPAAVAPGHG